MPLYEQLWPDLFVSFQAYESTGIQGKSTIWKILLLRKQKSHLLTPSCCCTAYSFVHPSPMRAQLKIINRFEEKNTATFRIKSRFNSNVEIQALIWALVIILIFPNFQSDYTRKNKNPGFGCIQKGQNYFPSVLCLSILIFIKELCLCAQIDYGLSLYCRAARRWHCSVSFTVHCNGTLVFVIECNRIAVNNRLTEL